MKRGVGERDSVAAGVKEGDKEGSTGKSYNLHTVVPSDVHVIISAVSLDGVEDGGTDTLMVTSDAA